MKHAIIFKTLWREKKAKLPSQKEIAGRLNWDESFFSRFLRGKQDVRTELFLQLVAIMPKDFQIEYWKRVAKELKLAGLPPSPNEGGGVGGGMETKISAIAQLLEFTANELKSMSQYHAEESMHINLEYVLQVLKEHRYTPDQFVCLCGIPDKDSHTAVAILEEKQKLENIDAFEQSLIISLLSVGLANVTGRSPEEELKRLHHGELNCRQEV